MLGGADTIEGCDADKALIPLEVENYEFSTSSSSSASEDLIQIIFAGHRGYGATQIQNQKAPDLRFPENSLISFQKVMESGADAVEFDLYLSLDKHLMVIHDDDLSINAHYKVQKANEMKRLNGEFCNIGELVIFPPNKTFVNGLPAKHLREAYDISKGMTPVDYPGTDQHKYRSIPVLEEVLDMVAEENSKRASLESPLPRVKLNIELKGIGSGSFVQKSIDDFNGRLEEDKRIKQEEIYYMSFLDRELAAIAGLVKDTFSPCPSANLILGIPTAMQYQKVGKDHSIDDPALNYLALDRVVIPLHQALKGLTARNGAGLSGVDMSMWDVGSDTIKYFCQGLKLPIHIAVVPYGPDDLEAYHIRPDLDQINKIAAAQRECLKGKNIMMVKTDNPISLQKMIQNQYEISQGEITNPKVRVRGKDSSSSTETAPNLLTEEILVETNSHLLVLLPKPTLAAKKMEGDHKQEVI